MTTRIGLVSDPHAAFAPLAEALALFRREGVDRVLCGGDIAGYGTELEACVALLAREEVEAIRGNHEAWLLQRLQEGEEEGDQLSRPSYDYLATLPSSRTLTVEGVSLYLVHASPGEPLMGGIRLLDALGRLDEEALHYWQGQLEGFDHQVLVVGHTHQAFAEQIGTTLVINPGSCCFNHSCAILDLPQQVCHWYPLSGRAIEPVWNWGVEAARGAVPGSE